MRNKVASVGAAVPKAKTRSLCILGKLKGSRKHVVSCLFHIPCLASSLQEEGRYRLLYIIRFQ